MTWKPVVMSTVLCQLTPFNLPAKKHLLILSQKCPWPVIRLLRSSLLWLRASTTRDMPGTFKNPQQPDSRQTVRGWSISSFPVINNCFPFSTCPACHPLPCVEPGHAAATVRGEQIRRGLGWVGGRPASVDNRVLSFRRWWTMAWKNCRWKRPSA
jgi:hypothetical protein